MKTKFFHVWFFPRTLSFFGETGQNSESMTKSKNFGRTVEIKLATKAKPSSGLRAWPTKRDAFHSFLYTWRWIWKEFFSLAYPTQTLLIFHLCGQFIEHWKNLKFPELPKKHLKPSTEYNILTKILSVGSKWGGGNIRTLPELNIGYNQGCPWLHPVENRAIKPPNPENTILQFNPPPPRPKNLSVPEKILYFLIWWWSSSRWSRWIMWAHLVCTS